MREMTEVLPGLFHWTAMHEVIKFEVSSHYLPGPGVLIDPMGPPEGIDWFSEHGPPREILLSNRHHYRHSGEYVEEFGCTVRCHSSGLHEFTKGEVVEPYEFGDELAGGIVAREVGAICPDDAAFQLGEHDALLFADGLINLGEKWLSFVPDQYMDDPPTVKQGLIASFRGLLALDFDNLLFAHGFPIVGGGKAAFEEFLKASPT